MNGDKDLRNGGFLCWVETGLYENCSGVWLRRFSGFLRMN